MSLWDFCFWLLELCCQEHLFTVWVFCFCFLNVHILFSWSETLVRSEIARAYDSSVSLLWKCLYSLLTSKVAIEVLEAFLVSDPANVTFVLLLPRSSRIIPLSPRLWNFIMMSLAVAVFTQCSGCLLGHFNCEIQVLASSMPTQHWGCHCSCANCVLHRGAPLRR